MHILDAFKVDKDGNLKMKSLSTTQCPKLDFLIGTCKSGVNYIWPNFKSSENVHRIAGNRERSFIFRKIVNDCQIKRFRLPLKLDVFDCHYIDFGIENVDFGNRKRKIVYNSAFTIAAYPV